MASADVDAAAADCQQLDLFPHHPGHLLFQDRDPPVACLLDDDGGAESPTLTAILGGSASTGGGDGSSPAASPVSDGDGDMLARRALRGRERWVYCRSSSASSSPSDEVANRGAGVDLWCGAPQALSLKLDYEEVLTAWSDRGPLYIDGDGPQVVPDLHHTNSPVLVEVGSTVWRVPEGDRKVENREVRVMRYKEKRRSRLFSKRIRYEVRKLNAEKRPRLKGRFVKRKDVE